MIQHDAVTQDALKKYDMRLCIFVKHLSKFNVLNCTSKMQLLVVLENKLDLLCNPKVKRRQDEVYSVFLNIQFEFPYLKNPIRISRSDLSSVKKQVLVTKWRHKSSTRLLVGVTVARWPKILKNNLEGAVKNTLWSRDFGGVK